MGIKGLTKLIGDNAPRAMSEKKFDSYFGRKIAMDASMAIYQFCIAVRTAQEGGFGSAMLTDESGETTSHLNGLLNRTIGMLEKGIKPAWVFDGKPPDLKAGEIAARREKREAAEKAQATAEESGNVEDFDKFNKRTLKVTTEMVADAKNLLNLMGVPVIEAPTEAEAQCAALCKAGKVYGVGSEDMDTLTFQAPILLRHLADAKAGKQDVLEINYATLLEELGFTPEQMIDLSILLGCDYCGTIRGVGPKTALQGITQHKTLEAFIKTLDTEKHPLPDPFPFEAIREFFLRPEVIDPETIELVWKDPNEPELLRFLVEGKGFDETRVKRAIERLRNTRSKQTQARLDTFFTPSASKRENPTPSGVLSKKARSDAEKKAAKGGKAKPGKKK